MGSVPSAPVATDEPAAASASSASPRSPPQAMSLLSASLAASASAASPPPFWLRAIPRALRSSPAFPQPPADAAVLSSRVWPEGVSYVLAPSSGAPTPSDPIFPPKTWPAPSPSSSPSSVPPRVASPHLPQDVVVLARTLHYVDRFSAAHASEVASSSAAAHHPHPHAAHGGPAMGVYVHSSSAGATGGGVSRGSSNTVRKGGDAGIVGSVPSSNALALGGADDILDSIDMNFEELDVGDTPSRRGSVPSRERRESHALAPGQAFHNPLRPTSDEIVAGHTAGGGASAGSTVAIDRFHPSIAWVTVPRSSGSGASAGAGAVRTVDLKTGVVEHVLGARGSGVAVDEGDEEAFAHPNSMANQERGVWVLSDSASHTLRSLVTPEAVRLGIQKAVSELGPSWAGRFLFHLSSPSFHSARHGLVDTILDYVGSTVSTIAGGFGSDAGFEDGRGREALLSAPGNVAYSPHSKRSFFFDAGSGRIRVLSSSGRVDTLSWVQGQDTAPDHTLKDLSAGGAGRRMVSQLGAEPVFAPAAGQAGGVSLAFDGANSTAAADVVVLASGSQNALWELRLPSGALQGTLRWIAGARVGPDGSGSAAEQKGFVDGEEWRARFSGITSLTVDALTGDIGLCDSANHAVRLVRRSKVASEGSRVYTLSGNPRQRGNVDGMGEGVRFDAPQSIASCLCDLHGGHSVTSGVGSSDFAPASASAASPAVAARPLPLHSMYVVVDGAYRCGLRKLYVCDSVPFVDDPFILPREK